MNWENFVSYHLPVLERDEVQHGVLISSILTNNEEKYWSFDIPGHCAVQIGEMPIVLGCLTKNECRNLAEDTAGKDYSGVLGPGLTTHWFCSRASELGIHFRDVEPQQIYALREPAKHPKIGNHPVPGHSRHIRPDETELFVKWLAEFSNEANPFDPLTIAASGDFIFWEVEQTPVAMAGTVRKLRSTCAITGVWVPPNYRGKSFAGAITAVVADKILEQGLIATLYTDLRVPASNRCYSRLGFQSIIPSFHYHR